MIKGIFKGIGVSLSILSILFVGSFFNLMSSVVPQFNLFFFLLMTFGLWQFIYLLPWYKRKLNRSKKEEGIGILSSSIIGIIILLLNLGYFVDLIRIDFEHFPKNELLFSELPKEVQNAYSEWMKTAEYGEFISTNESFIVKNYNTTMDDGFIILMKEGFKHHFIINGKHFVLQANKGDPFVLHDERFYYCKDLNLKLEKLENASFIEINLEGQLK